MPDSAKVGDVYVVATSGTYETHVCEVGDTMICTSTGTTEWPKTTWVVVEKNIDGAVTAKITLQMATYLSEVVVQGQYQV